MSTAVRIKPKTHAHTHTHKHNQIEQSDKKQVCQRRKNKGNAKENRRKSNSNIDENDTQSRFWTKRT